MYLEKPFSESEVPKAIIVLQRKAIEDVKNVFLTFENNFSNVVDVYVTGHIPANKSFSIKVSRSLTENGAFVESVNKLKDTLKFLSITVLLSIHSSLNCGDRISSVSNTAQTKKIGVSLPSWNKL